ncbi:MAG TPA: peptidylprolyl isomerase [Thermoleophilia bacterium]
MKKFIVATVILAVLVPVLALAACGGNKVPAGAIAAVGSGAVTQAQFDQIMTQAEAQYKSQAGAPPFPKAGTPQYNQLKASIVNYLVQNELIKEQAAKMDVSVTDKEYQDRLAQIVQQVGGQAKLDALLKKQGVTMADLESQLKSQMLQDKMRTKVGAAAKVTAADIQKYWNDPKNKAQFVTPESVDARHILVKTQAKAVMVEKLLVANNSDANWKKIAKQFSTDAGTKNAGGSLGNFPKGRMVPEIDKVAFSIKPGTVSAPVKTQFGWHVIEVTKKTPGATKTFEQAKPMIEQQLKLQLQATAWDAWLKKATKDAGIVYAAGFDPATLTTAPSPSGSPVPAASPSK